MVLDHQRQRTAREELIESHALGDGVPVFSTTATR
jgi:hypothetical protein